MSRIHLLSEEVASQVAAGEVIERPASVVKELVENSIDANAKRIEVKIRRGGVSTICVVDDGAGMDRDDALLCLERHATSKIRSGHDLAAISTLGFRGEALPSIASVSRFRLSTREPNALAGTEVVVNGGKIETVHDSGDAPGTNIEVRSLFYNLPARRKFLRSENTESSHVEQQLHLQAIGHPGIGFVFVNDEKPVYQLPPVSSLIDRIRDISGTPITEQLLEIPCATYERMTLTGFIGKPGVSRSTRAQQIVFINGRAIENSTIHYALREGYHTALMKGQYPVTFLFIEMDPAAVDVNVHPAKREVRFRDPSLVKEMVVETIRKTIESGRQSWSRTFAPPQESAGGVVHPEPSTGTLPLIGSPVSVMPPREGTGMRRENDAKIALDDKIGRDDFHGPVTNPPVDGKRLEDRSENFRILGVLGKLYILMENETGLVLVDQHAAHERILFEELRRKMEEEGVPCQRLLIPLTVPMSPRDSDWILQNSPVLQKMGIAIEQFGPGTFKIDALPQFIRTSDPLQLLRDIIDELRQTSAQTSKLRLGEDVIATTVCRHAVKANDYLREPELVRLIQDLLACELPYCCPHGRPTMIQISYSELEKKFGRKA